MSVNERCLRSIYDRCVLGEKKQNKTTQARYDTSISLRIYFNPSFRKKNRRLPFSAQRPTQEFLFHIYLRAPVTISNTNYKSATAVEFLHLIKSKNF